MANTVPVLEGSVVRLVPLSLAHLDALCAIGLKPGLWRATTIAVRTRKDMEAYVRSALRARDAGTALPFVIEDRATGAVSGTTRFHSMSHVVQVTTRFRDRAS